MDTPLLDGTARPTTPPSLIVVDVDGTLLTTTHEVTPATAREVRRVRASGRSIHRQQQREFKMAHRRDYHDSGLVFAKEWTDVRQRTHALHRSQGHRNAYLAPHLA